MGMREPQVDDVIQINGDDYAFDGVPGAMSIVYAEPGRKAKVYRLTNTKTSEKKALKVFYREFRNPQTDHLLYQNCQSLKDFFHSYYPSKEEKFSSALQVAERILILPENNTRLIESYSEFDHSLLMDWIDGDSWSNFVCDKEPLSSSRALSLASSFAAAISGLEKRNAAHCDLSGGNFVIGKSNAIELVDIEDLFHQDFLPPSPMPAGTGGYVPSYVHHKGLWRQSADRYAAAIILSEILCWQFGEVRNARHSMSYFAEGEPGYSETDRYKLMHAKLGELSPSLAELFERMWKSDDADNCPSVSEWKKLIDQLKPKELKCSQCLNTIQAAWIRCPFCGNWLGQDSDPFPSPSLGYEPGSLDFGIIDFEGPEKKISTVLNIWNKGTGVLTGEIVVHQPWLDVSQSNFSVRSGQEHLRLYIELQADCPRPNPGQSFRFPIGVILVTNAQEPIVIGGSYRMSSPGPFHWLNL